MQRNKKPQAAHGAGGADLAFSLAGGRPQSPRCCTAGFRDHLLKCSRTGIPLAKLGPGNALQLEGSQRVFQELPPPQKQPLSSRSPVYIQSATLLWGHSPSQGHRGVDVPAPVTAQLFLKNTL
ncbi:ubiquilin-1 [Platysternon megacephalum]|uniref:Ubiquilin-1 n=1 Tax=Platysternon megacephalum TaxID=55544 RepID=A0A4D9DRU1_9SAUR|nr:ubiquilin-1 [Platysternon megacephalum]